MILTLDVLKAIDDSNVNRMGRVNPASLHVSDLRSLDVADAMIGVSAHLDDVIQDAILPMIKYGKEAFK